MVDNCYGEFVEEKEPSDVGADLVVGSLIKENRAYLPRSVAMWLEERGSDRAVCLPPYFSWTWKEVGASLGVMQSFIRDFSLHRLLLQVH